MPTAPSAPATRPPRADARRNRDAVLAAARSALARGGLDTPMEAVARAAGVGVATVYRNFPTKAALVDAVIERSFRELTANAKAALAAPDVDRAFFDFLRDTGKVMARDRVLVAAAPRRVRDPAAAGRAGAVRHDRRIAGAGCGHGRGTGGHDRRRPAGTALRRG